MPDVAHANGVRQAAPPPAMADAPPVDDLALNVLASVRREYELPDILEALAYLERMLSAKAQAEGDAARATVSESFAEQTEALAEDFDEALIEAGLGEAEG